MFFKKPLFFKRLRNGYPPFKARREDAGYDLSAVDNVVLRPGFTATLKTRLCVQLPAGSVGLILGRSSLNSAGIIVSTGVIDAGYTGELAITIYNSSAQVFKINRSDRVAQLVVLKLADNGEAQKIDYLKRTSRANKGFGSSGR